jgi:hypothetical protein
MHTEITSTLNHGNNCYNLVKDSLFSRMLHKHINTETYKTLSFPVV